MKENFESYRLQYRKAISETQEALKRFNLISNPTKEDKEKVKALYLKVAGIAKKLADEKINGDSKSRVEYLEDYNYLTKKSEEFAITKTDSVPIPEITFDDVKGLDEVKDRIKNFIHIIKATYNQKTVADLYNVSQNMGMLLYGPPGTGKSMLTQAIANQLQLPLYVVSPADIFSSYVGDSEKKVKELFEKMEKNEEGYLLFIDECEAIFGKRTDNSERYESSVISMFLQKMEGFGTGKKRRVIIGATNHPWKIDSAFLRNGRLSNLVLIGLPDAKALEAIVEKKLRLNSNNPVKVEKGLTAAIIAGMIPEEKRVSGADLCGIIDDVCQKAIAIWRAKPNEGPPDLTAAMFKEAFDKHKPRLSEEMLNRYKNFTIE